MYNSYIPLSFSLPTAVKTFFKNFDTESENIKNLLEDNKNNNNNYQYQVKKTPTNRVVSEKRRNCHVDKNGNAIRCESIKCAITDTQVWRRLSLQSYKKRKQEKEAQKSKPLIPQVLRTYDKRGMQKATTPDWL